mmetsp:Transcript_33464/g.106845  ORF Transcript_33464/g.106845 Transcript_33464/m.106845 type:complete len:850 (-) Transcript_33464:784-3333(-)
MSSSEVTDVFFGVTKLFQSTDASLRRMIYFFIKEVAETCNPDDIIIVTSSLTKDMNSNEDLFRANSIRVLSRMIDATMLGAIERYVKQAIVDKNAMVSSSALVAGLHLSKGSPDVVRRWVGEVQEALHSPSAMVQFHALALLYEIKSHDRLAISKMVTQLARGPISSPCAACLLIRYISSSLAGWRGESTASSVERAAYQYLELSLKDRSEAVIFEAAKALCSMPGADDRDLGPAVASLQLFLSSPKPPLRLAAMRALSRVSTARPAALVKCNDDMEALISDSNRSVATFAITTLLKTGSESSVDRLMKQISSFMTEISDDFKVVVVTAIRELCLKYPPKHQVLIGFLANFLREEGGFEFKSAIVDAIVVLMHAVADTKETSLFHLCEFIEDCEFTALSTQILHLVGSLGPATRAPARYIRFIYNRIILENSAIRAAAVSALAKFAVRVPALRSSIKVLLHSSLRDEDDEVRDRATLALRFLGGDLSSCMQRPDHESNLRSPTEEVSESCAVADAPHSTLSVDMLFKPLPLSFVELAGALRQYEKVHGADNEDAILSYSTLPIADAVASTKRVEVPSRSGLKPESNCTAFYKIPEIATLGPILRSTASAPLTESETEYVVSYVKHILEHHLVLEFSVMNTIQDQVLQDAHVVLDSPSDVYQITTILRASSISCGETGTCWVALQRSGTIPDSVGIQFEAQLKFSVVEVDAASGELLGDEDGFQEEYPLEDVELNIDDFIEMAIVEDFRRGWTHVETEEVIRKYALQFKDVRSAVNAIAKCLGMQLDQPSEESFDDSVAMHNFNFYGIYVSGIPVYARAQLHKQNDMFILKLAVRCEVREISTLLADSVN